MSPNSVEMSPQDMVGAGNMSPYLEYAAPPSAGFLLARHRLRRRASQARSRRIRIGEPPGSVAETSLSEISGFEHNLAFAILANPA